MVQYQLYTDSDSGREEKYFSLNKISPNITNSINNSLLRDEEVTHS